MESCIGMAFVIGASDAPLNTCTRFWEKIEQRLNYLHMNPVNAGYVIKPEDWLNSSARHYARLEQRFELELIE